MRFKDWIQTEENRGGSVVTSLTNGDTTDLPGAQLNTNMPVQSKISTKDGSDRQTVDPYDSKVKPDQLFHFNSPSDKTNASRERQSQWIDTKNRRARFVTIPPDKIY